ncbi:MAG: DUF6913 domain-containing protein [Bacteroidota bacterium]|jgi:hypothetical protein
MDKSNSYWNSIQRLVVVFPYVSELYYREFRKQLEHALNDSSVKKLEVIVSIPAEIKKEELPPHRLIHFISPKDFNFFGKLKGDLLGSVLDKDFDALIWFTNEDKKLAKVLTRLKVKHRIGVNCEHTNFDIDIKGGEKDPGELVNFAKSTLLKLS